MRCATFLLANGSLPAARKAWIPSTSDDWFAHGDPMFNSATIVQWAAVLAIAGVALMPFTVRAETPPAQDAQRATGCATPESGVDQMAIPPTQYVPERAAEMPASGLRFNDPARRCGNMMIAWEDLCNYAGRTRVSVDTSGARP